MATIQTDAIMAHLVSLLDTQFATSLSLELCTAQDLSAYPALADLESACPFIMIRPAATEIEFRGAAGKRYRITDTFRIAYGRAWTNGEYLIAEQLDDVQSVADFLVAEFGLPSLTLTGGNVVWSRPTRVLWEGTPEDNLAAAWNQNIRVSVIEYQVCYYVEG